MIYEKLDKVRSNQRRVVFKKRIKKCHSLYVIIALALILGVSIFFVFGHLTRYYSSLNENPTFFENITVSLKLENKCDFEPQFDLRLIAKDIRVKNKLHSSQKLSLEKCSANFIEKIFSFFTSIGYFLNVISQKDSFFSVFDTAKNFRFKIYKIVSKDAQIDCYNVSIVNQLTEESQSCFVLANNDWFRGLESYVQPSRPINELTFDDKLYTAG